MRRYTERIPPHPDIGAALIYPAMPNGTNGRNPTAHSEGAYRQLVERAQDVVYHCDRLGRITFANEAATAVLGYTSDRLIGRHCFEFVPPEHHAKVRSIFDGDGIGRSGIHTEVPAIASDDSVVWLSQFIQPRLENGRVVGIQAIARDISERKRAETALREGQDRLHVLSQITAPNGDDLDTKMNEALEQATRLLGMDVGILSRIEGAKYTVEYCYAPGIELLPGSVHQLGYSYCSLTLAANDLLAISHTRLPEKQRHPCSSVIRLESYLGLPILVYGELYGTLNFAGRRPRSTMFSMLDKETVRILGSWVSSALEKRRAITDLAASEKKYRSSFDHAAIGKAHVSRDGKWLHVNGALCGIVGYTEDELVGRSFQEITHPEDLEVDLSYVRAMLERRISSYSIEKRYFKKDGSIVWVLLTVSAAYDDADEVSYFVAEIQDISAQKELEHQLIQQAQHDSLTGLANRNVFMARLSEELAWCKNDPSTLLAVLFMDFDRFKMVNDSLGHTSGDRLLVIIAERIKESLREGGLFARLGGDEFGVLLPGVSGRADAAAVAETIQEALRAPVVLKEQEVFPSASIGIVITDGGYSQPEDVLRDADTAMYKAKEGDGASYRIFSKEMHVQAAERLRMDSELRRAVDNEEFVPYYQPLVELATGALVGFEALARWEHPVNGAITPETFIPHAEEIGLIKQIDRQVMGRACEDLRDWRNEFGDRAELVMHVNCSAHHLLDASFVGNMLDILDRMGLDPSSLMVELTESVFIEDLDRAAEEIHRLKLNGIHMCIDDFGTGYSSLHALHTLPIDALKIDRTFLAAMSNEGRQQQIVHTVLDIAKRLEMTVVAEGIENDRQLAALRDLDCAFGQGYLFSGPLTAEKAKQLIGAPIPWESHWG